MTHLTDSHRIPSTARLVSDPAAWWRRTCWIPGMRLAMSGDLPRGSRERAEHLDRWVDEGVTNIIDVRIEHSDEHSVARLNPEVRYHWLGVDDDGGQQPDEWFDAGVDAALTAFGDPTAKVLVHCHMGVNRGPSMAYAILLATGWHHLAALEAIRTARPIAASLYADQALAWWHRRSDVPAEVAVRQQRELDAWCDEHPVDASWVISRIWRADVA